MNATEKFWQSRGFVPWRCGSLQGVHRRLTVVKSSMLGEVGKYYTDDYIVWAWSKDENPDWVRRNWKPARDVMVQRVVFVGGQEPLPWRRRTRTFMFGLRGFLEVYRYQPVSLPDRGMRDLAELIDTASRS